LFSYIISQQLHNKPGQELVIAIGAGDGFDGGEDEADHHLVLLRAAAGGGGGVSE
jgi:hypothetical protein